MKIEITGRVDKIEGIQPVKKGFIQRVFLEIPEVKDDFDRVTKYAEHFVVTIWSNQQSDSRFLSSRDLRSKKKATVYLKGERWWNENRKEYNYAHKLNLERWM